MERVDAVKLTEKIHFTCMGNVKTVVFSFFKKKKKNSKNNCFLQLIFYTYRLVIRNFGHHDCDFWDFRDFSGDGKEARGALTGAIKYATGFNRLLGTHRTPKLYLTGLLGRGVTIQSGDFEGRNKNPQMWVLSTKGIYNIYNILYILYTVQ